MEEETGSSHETPIDHHDAGEGEGEGEEEVTEVVIVVVVSRTLLFLSSHSVSCPFHDNPGEAATVYQICSCSCPL